MPGKDKNFDTTVKHILSELFDDYEGVPDPGALINDLAESHQPLFGASTKKRGPSKKTLKLREAILDVFNDVDKPVTVRQMFYLLDFMWSSAKDGDSRLSTRATAISAYAP